MTRASSSHVIVMLLALFSQVACTSAEKLLLRWQLGPGENLGYRADMYPVQNVPDISSDALRHAERLPDALLNVLNPPGDAPFAPQLIVLQAVAPDELRLRLAREPDVSQFTKFRDTFLDGILKVAAERFGRPATQAEVEAIRTEVQGKFDELFEQQRRLFMAAKLNRRSALECSSLDFTEENLIAMYFQLPEAPVAVGDSWTTGLVPFQLSGDVEDLKTEKLDRAWLVETTSTEDEGRVAIIHLAFVSTASGLYRPPGQEPIHASGGFNVLGKGRYLVDRGRWGRLALLTTITLAGLGDVDESSLAVLQPLDTAPDELVREADHAPCVTSHREVEF